MLRRVGIAVCLFAAASSGAVTYRDVEPVIREKCRQCHHPGDIAPFSLSSYDDAQTWAPDIRDAVSRGIMPPWKPVPGYGEFRGAFGLSPDEKQLILDWVDQGAQEGEPLQPSPASGPAESEWRLGDPGLVLTMPRYTPPRTGDTYRCFVLSTGLAENRFVAAYQVLPGEKQSVHHVLLFLDQSGQADKLDGTDGAPGYSCFGGPNVSLGIGGLLGGWAPGSQPAFLPEGIACLLPGNARIVMQVHYHPNGKTAPDETRVGLYFAAPDSVRKRLVALPILNTTFQIPAGDPNYEVKATLPVLPFLSGQAILIAPHMHLLGKQIRMDLQLPDGTRKPLIYIDNWDFNWQGFYTFREPVALPSGAAVLLSAIYDNSENNPRNPNNPVRPVRWGEGTNDEMCLGFLGVVFDYENLLPLNGSRIDRSAAERPTAGTPLPRFRN